MSFELDTSGWVTVVDVTTFCRPQLRHETHYAWDDLDPFTQGYVRAALNSLPMPPNGWRVTYEGKRIGWMLTATPAEALAKARADNPHHVAGRFHVHALGFSDLAPSTLEAMMKDCAEAIDLYCTSHANREALERAGSLFWSERGKGRFVTAFPPLTLSLGDDGLIYAKETGR